MKRISKPLATLLLMLLCVSFTVEAKDKVAVFVEGNVNAVQEQIVNNAFMSRLSSSSRLVVLERNNLFLNAITREHDYQTSGEVPESQIRRIAVKYGADYVIAVSVIIEDDELYMSARIINIETGAVEKTVSQDRQWAGNKTLRNMANNVAYRLLDQFSK